MKNRELELFKPGPLHPYRFKIYKMLEAIPVKTGDIVFRQDNYSYFGIKFSKLVCVATKSKYDHAAIFYVENSEIWVLEVNDAGCSQIRLLDWIDYSAINEMSIFRLKDDSQENISKIEQQVKDFLAKDPDYDFTFGNTVGSYYCNSAVCYIYEQAGFKLFDAMYIKDIMNKWFYPIFFCINWLVFKLSGKGFAPDKPVYFVGNSKKGMVASKLLNFIALIKV